MFQIIMRVLTLLTHQKRLVIWLTISNFIFAVLILIEPIFFKEIIDILISFSDTSNQQYSLLVQTLVLWVIVGVITISIRLYVSIYSDRLAHNQVERSVFWFFNHAQNLSMRFHLNSNSGQLVKQITKWVDGIFETQLNIFRRALPNIFTIIALIPVVLYFNAQMWAIVIFLGLVSWIVTYFLSSYTFKKQESIEEIYSKMSSHYGDTFSNISIVKSFSLWKLKNKQLWALTDERIKKQYPILTWWGVIVSFSQVLRIVVSIVIIFFWSFLHIQWDISIGEIVMFLSFALIFLSAVEDLTWTLEGMFWRLAGIKDYFKIIDTPIEVQDKVWAKKLWKIKGNIEFKNLTFSYDGKRKVLKNISIDIKPGEKVAFVWHTGSGKTTMTNMLLRFFEPQKGDILIDGKSIYDITQESLRKNIWIVFQDNSLFNTTILENIRLDSKATRADIQRVTKKSHSADFIQNLSDGLDTIVWERWVKLSWWEKQRLAIARAFLKDAPILILDEATSALDAHTEKYLQASFDELMSGRTTFIIAHRLSTIMKADRIFVFDQGEIVEQGSYKELMKKKWKFEKLVEAQTKGFIE